MNTITNAWALPAKSLSTLTTSIFVGTKPLNAILFALLFIISMVLVPWGTSYADHDPDAVEWHPGHYYAILSNRKDEAKYLDKVYRELRETPALRGIQVRYRWAELETEKGVYDFTSIDNHLAMLAEQGDHLVIMLTTKSFNPDLPLVPDYLKAELYDGGIFPFSSFGASDDVIKGYNVKLWNDKVKYRLVQLISALGERYNKHHYFEAIGMDETAMGQPMIPVSTEQIDLFYDNLLAVNRKLRVHFPNTVTFQFTNFPRSTLETFVTKLRNMGASLGGPDVRPDDKALTAKDMPNSPDGVYAYYPKLSGVVPLTPSVMPSNYYSTARDDSGHEPTVQELLDFARDELKANYLFWSRTMEHYPEVLELLNYEEQTRDPAGGLDPDCPAKYSSCIE